MFQSVPRRAPHHIRWLWILFLAMVIGTAPLLMWAAHSAFSMDEVCCSSISFNGEEEMAEGDVFAPSRNGQEATCIDGDRQGRSSDHKGIFRDDRSGEVPSPPPRG